MGKKPASQSDALRRFLGSMIIDYEKWHDGVGYDLEALAQLSPDELKSVETTLIEHQPRDWRDVEALAHIDSPAARKAVEAALKSRDPQIRQTAMDCAGEKADPAEREKLLIQSLEKNVIYGGLTQAIDEAEDFHPPGVVDALFRGALNREGDVAVHFAALIMFLHGKAKEAFDWDHRPFFLRFNTDDRNERQAVFDELCETVGVDPKKYA
jgi:hypothetical protein